jgi:hypothetical protein
MRFTLPALVVLAGTAHAQPVDAPPAEPDAQPADEVEPEDAAPTDVVEPAPIDEPEPGAKDDKKKDDKKKKKVDPELVPDLGGYIQILAQRPFDTNDDGDRGNSTFRIQRARIKIDGKIMKKLGYSLSVNPIPEAVDDILRDAYVWSRHVPFHELRVGQQKTQFGYEIVESSTKLYYVRRSQVSQNLSRGPTSRDIGVGIVGEIPIANGFSIEDGLTIVNGAGQNVATDTTRRKSYWGRLGGRYENKAIDIDARLGVSGAIGDHLDPGLDPTSELDDTFFEFTRIGVDAQIEYTYAYVAAEYVSGTNTDLDTNIDADAKGYYVVVAGKTPWKAGPVVRYDTYEDDFDDYERWTLGAYYGRRAATLRAMINFEHRPSRDDRLVLWLQAKF